MVLKEDYEEIYFFGDKVYEGGNDFGLYHDPSIKKGYAVDGPVDTEKFLREDFIAKAE